jgi:hypothetical protein
VVATNSYYLNPDYYLNSTIIKSAVEVSVKELPLYLGWEQVSPEITKAIKNGRF